MTRLIDLSHTVEAGMITYKGLPAPVICDYWSREESRKRYTEGTEFQIGKIEMVANTGTYVDAPFHRYADGKDLSELPLESLANLEGIVVRVDSKIRSIDFEYFRGLDLEGKAVLVQSGWDKHWRTEQYFGLVEYRRHFRRNAAGSHDSPRPEHPSRRASLQSRQLARWRIPVFCCAC
ncbi:MAG: hypothetical protein HW374_1067 [Bacteroidetes bacterium]|nr:hypothetical protein [Bacteroidota bacterium]